jgi:cell division septation protein DedD
MSVAAPYLAGTAALEARQASLRRQIAIVAALILVLSIALAATALFAPLRSADTSAASATGGERPSTGRKTLPASGSQPAAAAADVAASAAGAASPAAVPTPGGAPPAAGVTDGAPVPGGERALNPGGAPAALPAATGESASGAAPHYVELGTYVQPARVDALRERLEQHRFQALLETRLRVGPFATRGEAHAAHARLSELGFAPGAVVVEKP